MPKRISKKAEPKLPKKREMIFRVILWSIAPLFFLLLELGLRLGNYGGDVRLFSEMQWKNKKYYTINPNVVKRYFSRKGFATYVSRDVFAYEKPANAYRIFCLGASTTIGFPYMFNAAFSGLLKDRLTALFPDKNIEVVNVGVTAVNSFTVADFAEEIMDYAPDLLIVYMGHNEFYGALGIGSTELGGKSWAAVKLYLALRKIKVVPLLRDGIEAARAAVFKTEKFESRQSLMEQMVREKHVRYRSRDYAIARDYFQRNLSAIIQTAKAHHVGIMVSTLVSNLRDQPPFVSLHSDTTSPPTQKQWEALFDQGLQSENAGEFHVAKQFYAQARALDDQRADLHFRMAKCYEGLGDDENALQEYRLAKDFDALRFRASDEFNEVIRALGREQQIPVVDMDSAFAKNSPNGILGKELFGEHVHPNFDGYFLMAKTFCRVMADHNFIRPRPEWNWSLDKPEEQYRRLAGVTDFDHEVAKIRIGVLKSRWPFQASEVPFEYHPENVLPQTAWDYANGKIGWGSAHEKLAKAYLQMRQLDKAEQEYWAIAKVSLYDPHFLLMAGDLQAAQNKHQQAIETFSQAQKIEDSPFVHAKLAASYFALNQFDRSIEHFQQALRLDQNASEKFSPAQRLRIFYMLGKAFALTGNTNAAEAQLAQLRQLAPAMPETKSLEEEIKRLQAK